MVTLSMRYIIFIFDGINTVKLVVVILAVVIILTEITQDANMTLEID